MEPRLKRSREDRCLENDRLSSSDAGIESTLDSDSMLYASTWRDPTAGPSPMHWARLHKSPPLDSRTLMMRKLYVSKYRMLSFH